MSAKKGVFITFEGPDGSGKSTHSLMLYRFLKRNGYDAVYSREPGGTPFSENIRELLLDTKLRVVPLAELLLYAASRAQHTEQLIQPCLAKNKIVICDRYSDATVAYQGYGRGLDRKLIHGLNRIATSGLVPGLTVLLDIPASGGLARAARTKRAGHARKDRLEKEAISFHRRVRDGYLEIARRNRKRFRIISTDADTGSVQLRVRDTVMEYFRHRGIKP